MNLAAPIINTPRNPPATHQGGGFMHLIVKASGMTRKDLVAVFRWSKTYVDMIISGEKNDPLEQTKLFCAELFKKGRGDLVPAVLVYVAGGDDFDGRVLSAVQVEALKKLAEVIKP